MPTRTRSLYLTTLVGAVGNLLLTAFKLVAGVVGGSAAMLADGVHSLSDLATDAVVFVCVRIAGAPHDDDHEYGHGKYETLGTAIISLLLLVVGAGIFWDGATSIWRACCGDTLPQPGGIALVAALVSIAVKELLYQYTAAVGRRENSSVVVANAWHHRSDAFSSIGTALGIGGAIFLGEAWRVLDPVAAVVVSLFILRMGCKLLKPCIDELVEKSLSEEEGREILAIIESQPGVSSPHNLRTRRIGNYCAIDVHFRMDGDTPIRLAHIATRQIEDRLRDRFGPDTIICTHVEPVKGMRDLR